MSALGPYYLRRSELDSAADVEVDELASRCRTYEALLRECLEHLGPCDGGCLIGCLPSRISEAIRNHAAAAANKEG